MHQAAPRWPPGSGEMAERIGAHDWAATPLGPLETWPQSLRTAVELMLASPQPACIGWGPDLVSLYNEGYIRLAGSSHPAALGLPHRMVWPEIRDESDPVAEAVIAGKSSCFLDQPVALTGRSDRSISWFTVSWVPLRNDSGEIAGFYCSATETTDRVLAGQARDRNYRTLIESIDEGYCLVEIIRNSSDDPVDMRYLEVNKTFERQTGLHDTVGKTHADLGLDTERYWFETYGEVARTGVATRFESYHEPTQRWYDVFASPSDGAPGDRVALLFTDVTARKRATDAIRESENRAHLLLAELQHRVRNILSVIRSVFTRTIEMDGSLEEMADHFRGRLDALARTQVVVTQNPRGKAGLEDLVREELLSVGAADSPQLSIEGPEAELSGEAAESIGLVVHELTTNSIKYGALRFPDASLTIRWAVNVDHGGLPHLVFSWEEQGVPAMPVNPGREGFGTELITRALPYRLGAETSFELRPGGVRCAIDLPLPRGVPLHGAM
jgi:two-component sensor histidine kinase